MKSIITTIALAGCSICALANEPAPAAAPEAPPPPEVRERALPPKALEMAERMIGRFDLNGSGELDQQELARLLHHLRKQRDGQKPRMKGDAPRPPRPPRAPEGE